MKGFNDEEDDECVGLLALWRFDEDLCPKIKDTSANNLEGIIKGDKYSLESFRGDCPLENEDKWGKSVSDQQYLELEGGTHLKTDKQEWHKKELKSFSFEVWFNPTEEKGILLSSSDGNLMLMYRQGKFTIIVNKHKLTPDVDHGIKLHSWNHVCLSLNAQDKWIRLFHNGKQVLTVSPLDFSIKKIGKNHLLIAPEFKGRLTEIRLWKRAKELEDVKSNLSIPLSIVSEQAAVIIISINNPGDKSTAGPAITQSDNFDFCDLGLDNTNSGEYDNWNFDTSQSQVSISSEKEGLEIPVSSGDDGWGIAPPKEPGVSPKEEVFTPKDSLALRQEQADTIMSVFGKFKFLSSLSTNDSLESLYQSQFSSLSNQSAFLQRLSSLLLATVKKSRSSYLRDDFDSAVHLVDKVFSLVKEVGIDHQHFETIATGFSGDSQAKLKTVLKKYVQYNLWFRGLKKARASGSLEKMMPIVDLLFCLAVNEIDKTLLAYAIVKCFKISACSSPKTKLSLEQLQSFWCFSKSLVSQMPSPISKTTM